MSGEYGLALKTYKNLLERYDNRYEEDGDSRRMAEEGEGDEGEGDEINSDADASLWAYRGVRETIMSWCFTGCFHAFRYVRTESDV